MNTRLAGIIAAGAVIAGVVWADTQTWNDSGPSSNWSTNETNWGGGAVWTNGNSAVFTGGGGLGVTVDVAAIVNVANITFQTNGYVIADANSDGTLSITGLPSVVTVVNAGDTGTVAMAFSGSGGLTKAGNGTLCLNATSNSFNGVLVVSNGVLRLSKGGLYALGAGGTGNETIIRAGATLDFNGAYTNPLATAENFQIAGSGVDGRGALINSGANFMNGGFGTLSLLGDSTIGCLNRIDIRNTVSGNGYTLTKNGAAELAVGADVLNCKVVINAGNYTYMSQNALGGSDFETVMNGGAVRSYGGYTTSERFFCNGGSFVAWGYGTLTFNIAGRVTLNSNVVVTAGNDRAGYSSILEFSGLLEGAGGIQRTYNGGTNFIYVTCNTNTYSGPTIVDSSTALYVGKTNLYSGILGVGVVTNSGSLYAYSGRLCQSNLVNFGSLYCNTGTVGAVNLISSGNLYLNGGILGSGTVVNSGSLYANSGSFGPSTVANSGTLYLNGSILGPCAVTNTGVFYCLAPLMGTGNIVNYNGVYFDRGGTTVSSNAFFGSGAVNVRYGSDVVLSSAFASNGMFRVAEGSLTLTNGTSLFVTNWVMAADRGVWYPYSPTNMTAKINVYDGSSLSTRYIVMGDGTNVPGGLMSGTINQYGGKVTTFDCTAESNGIRIAHWPQGNGTYNMMGGTLTIDKGWDLCVATDGTGWVHQTGGEIYTSRVMLHERMNNTSGFGRLTVEGGVLNIGLTNGILNIAATNGISADGTALCLVEYGGKGGVIRAVTNFVSELKATLYGTNENAITFDTTSFAINLSGNLTGAGGLNKAGSGVLTLTGTNTYSGGTIIKEGTLTIAARTNVPNGVLKFSISTNGTCGVLHAMGDLSLTGLSVGVSNPEQLDKNKSYPVITYGGAVGGAPDTSLLPTPWYLHYDWANKSVNLRASVGTVLQIR